MFDHDEWLEIPICIGIFKKNELAWWFCIDLVIAWWWVWILAREKP